MSDLVLNPHLVFKKFALRSLSRTFGSFIQTYFKPQAGVCGLIRKCLAIAGARARTLFAIALLMFSNAGANERETLNEAAAIPFESLSEQQQQVLAPMRERWEGLSGQRQQRLMKGADRWSGMDEAERQKAREKMQRWRNLSPDKKQRMLKRLQRFRSMPPERRQRLQRTFQRFKQLPEGERRALREKWRNANPIERRELRRQLMEKQRTSQ